MTLFRIFAEKVKKRGYVSQSRMITSGVVEVQEGRQGRRASGGGPLGALVGPAPETGLNEALGFAVGLGAVGAGAQVTDPAGREQGPDRLAGVGESIVGHHSLNRDAEVTKPADAAGEEGRTGQPVLGRQDLGVSQPGGVIDRHMQVIGAQTPAASDLGMIPVNAVANCDEARQRLEAHVEQLAGAFPLVAHARGGAPRLIQPPQPGGAQPPPHGGPGQLERGGDLRPGVAPGGAKVNHPPDGGPGRTPRRVVRSGGPVEQPGRSFGEKASAPLVERARADVQGSGHEGDGLPVLEQAADRFDSPPDGQPGILMGVH